MMREFVYEKSQKEKEMRVGKAKAHRKSGGVEGCGIQDTGEDYSLSVMGHLHSLTLVRRCEGSRHKFVGGKLEVEVFHARVFNILWELEGTTTCWEGS